MSELKVYVKPLKTNMLGETIVGQSYYLKSEADKVIVHHKFKRCLAIAWWCSAELGMLVSTWESKIKYYKRWHKRWLELAEKFKEAK